MDKQDKKDTPYSVSQTTNLLNLPQLPAWTKKTLHPTPNGHLLHQRKYAISTLTHLSQAGKPFHQLQLPTENAAIHMPTPDSAVILCFTEMCPYCTVIVWDLKSYGERRMDWKMGGIGEVGLIGFQGGVVGVWEAESQGVDKGDGQMSYYQSSVTISFFKYNEIDQDSKPYLTITDKTPPQSLTLNRKLVPLSPSLLCWPTTQADSNGSFALTVYNPESGLTTKLALQIGGHLEGRERRLTDIWEVREGLLYVQVWGEGEGFGDFLWDVVGNQVRKAEFSCGEEHRVQFVERLRNCDTLRDNKTDIPTLYIHNTTLIHQQTPSNPLPEDVQICHPFYQPTSSYSYSISQNRVQLLFFTKKKS